MIEVAVIAGPAGVGKSATAYEISAQLRAARIAHAVIDTDALDHIYPRPDDPGALTERNLTAVWRALHEQGAARLIVTGVYLHRDAELALIQRATQAERHWLVELTASDAALAERVNNREIGSDREAQLQRTLRQAQELGEARPSDAAVIPTDSASVVETAERVVAITSWAKAAFPLDRTWR